MTTTETNEMTDNQQLYHYTESGLKDVWLDGGVEYQETEFGRVSSIVDVDGLHRAIALALVREKKALSGREARFLRHELEISQASLGEILGVDGQTIARWEKGENKKPKRGPLDRALRSYVIAKLLDEDIAKTFERIAELENELHTMIVLKHDADNEWIRGDFDPVAA